MKGWSSFIAAAVLPLAVGCAQYRLPHIDPSGEHLFIYDSPPPACPAPASCVPCVPAPVPVQPAGVAPPPIARTAATPYDDVATILSPYRTVAPVGSQVVLVAGVRIGDGYLRTNRRLEWSIAPCSVGQFLAVGENGLRDLLVGDFNNPRVVTDKFAVGSTSRVPERVGCVNILRGQSWVTVGSAVEGTTQLSLFAPEVVVTNERVKSAVIYWIDAAFGFPPPAITAAGTSRTLTTTVERQTTRCPRAGWIVRYEIACGPAAVFAPAGTPSIDVATNDVGQATAEIVQKEASPGTTQVRIQIFRPADMGSTGGQPLLVKEDGGTLVTWTESSPAMGQTAPATAAPAPAVVGPMLEVTVSGPPSATVGEQATFNVTVANRGQTPTIGLSLKDFFGEGLEHRSGASPISPRALQDLAPGGSLDLKITFRVTRAGQLCHRVEVYTADGGRATKEACVTALPGVGTMPPPGDQPTISPPPTTSPPPTVSPPPAAAAVVSPPGATGGSVERAIPRENAAPSKIAVVVDNLNKIAAGTNQRFQIRVTNRGSLPENDVAVSAQVPAGSRSELGTEGPGGVEPDSTSGGIIRFKPVPNLSPGETITFLVVATTRQAGPFALHAEAVTHRMTQPIAAENTVEVLPSEQ